MRFLRRKHPASLTSRALPFLVRWITPAGNRFQRWAEPCLMRIERQLSRRQKIVWISLFCIFSGTYSLAVLVGAMTGRPNQGPTYSTPQTISRPLSLPNNDIIPQFHKRNFVLDSNARHSPKNN